MSYTAEDIGSINSFLVTARDQYYLGWQLAWRVTGDMLACCSNQFMQDLPWRNKAIVGPDGNPYFSPDAYTWGESGVYLDNAAPSASAPSPEAQWNVAVDNDVAEGFKRPCPFGEVFNNIMEQGILMARGMTQQYESTGTYRAFYLNDLSRIVIGRALGFAARALVNRIYGHVNGLKFGDVSTSSRNWVGQTKEGIFNGKEAYAFPIGRPALSEAEWIRRYKARLQARNKTGRHRKGHGVKVPPAKHRDLWYSHQRVKRLAGSGGNQKPPGPSGDAMKRALFRLAFKQ